MSIESPVPENQALNEPEVASDSEETLSFRFDFPGSGHIITLHSCDSYTFHVSKLYIVNSSPVLRDLMPQSVSTITSAVPDGKEQEELAEVKLPESGAILHSLLTFIFPVVSVLPSTSEKVIELLAVAQKYQMDSVLNHIRGSIAREDPPFIRPETAFHIYFLSRKHELHQEALQAARFTLRLPMVIEDLGGKPGASDMTGAYLLELWTYHERVRTDLKSSVLEFRKSGLPDVAEGLRCKPPNAFFQSDNLSTFPLWIENYIASIADTLHLFDLIPFENAWACHIQETLKDRYGACSCVSISSQVIRTFREALAAVIHDTIEKADSTLALVEPEEGSTSENSDPPFVPLSLNVPEANIILRSSDQISFLVHKSVLAMSSPFFEDLLSLPQPPHDELVDGLPVVQLPEDARLLNSLVSLLYPIRRIQPGSYEKVFALLKVCHKYDMVSIQFYIRDEVKRGNFPAPSKAQAFSAYAKASCMGLIPEMEHAAQLTLGQPMTFESLGEELWLFKGQTLCKLIRYRALVANSANSKTRTRKLPR